MKRLSNKVDHIYDPLLISKLGQSIEEICKIASLDFTAPQSKGITYVVCTGYPTSYSQTIVILIVDIQNLRRPAEFILNERRQLYAGSLQP